MELFINYLDKTLKYRMDDSWLTRPIAEFIEMSVPVVNNNNPFSYYSSDSLLTLNEWSIYKSDDEFEWIEMFREYKGTELTLESYGIRDGDCLKIAYKPGRSFLRKDLFWVYVKFESKKIRLEILDPEKTTPNDIIDRLKEEELFNFPYTSKHEDIKYHYIQRKLLRAKALLEFSSLVYNKVKCGDTLTIIPSYICVSKEAIKGYQQKQLPTPNGDGYYVKKDGGYDGPFTPQEINNMNLPFDALVSKSPQYNNWFPLYEFDVQREILIGEYSLK